MQNEQAGMGIIIVDDAQALRGALRAILIGDGYRVLGDLASGEKLLETIKRLQPQIVCLDLDLPGTDGMTLLQEVHAAHPEVAVVMISGSKAADDEKLAAETGAAGFIRKPFSQAQILSELRQVAHAQKLLIQALKNKNQPAAAQNGQIGAVIADDSDTMRQLLKAILNQAGVLVKGEASNGEEAVRLVAETRPQLVFLDYAMPVMNGLDALKLIRVEHPSIKAMMITAYADREVVKQSAQAGARGYILKPYRPDKVIEAVKHLINS